IIDLTTSPFTIKAVVPVGKNPGAKPAITADGKYAVVAASDNGTVSIIDLTLSIPTVVKTIYVGGYPRGVAIIDDIALIACRSTYYIQEIDLNTFNVIGSFFANYSPSKIAISRPTAANNDPVAVNDTVTTFEDMFVMISVLVNDFDADGDALTVTGVTDPEHGSITWTPDGIIKYTPDENYYGTDTFTYTITDGELTAIATVTVTITPMNDAPVAVAGSDQVVDKVTTVYLDGTQSYDPDGESLTYQWEFLSKPIGSNAVLSGANTARPTFEPDLKGEYVIQLTVTDSWNETSSSLVKVCFRNLQPVADIVTASSVMVGETVTLDGSGSSDMNGDALSYQWSFLSVPVGSQATIASPQAMVTSFVPDLPGTYIVQLIVNDGNIDSQPVIAMIQVTSPIIEVIESIENTENIVISLDSAVFKTDNMQNALLNKLSSVMWEIKAGDYKGVLSKLQNDILKKTDGYMTIGAPDKNDWIQDRETQVILYYSILEIIENLKKLL
ncbi:MAG TPA: Ig-like domain-containing protein, partial [Methanothermobacter sp.]|nr:Ig-like domain-containing protein [Methanothermobacter sp.]